MRRSERIVRLAHRLWSQPGVPISLTEMADQLEAAKSSLSEDLAIIRSVLEVDGVGTLHTQMGAAGGVMYMVDVSAQTSRAFAQRIMERLTEGHRVLPGGYVYMSDVLAEPEVLQTAGKMFARMYAHLCPDVILTVETKGIPLAVMTAQFLNCPVIVARRDHDWIEGSSVSANYVSGSDRRMRTMSLSKRSIREGSRVLIIDDFMKAGGTVRGMTALMAEFSAVVVGTGVFMETEEPAEKLVSDYISLLSMRKTDDSTGQVEFQLGKYYTQVRDQS